MLLPAVSLPVMLAPAQTAPQQVQPEQLVPVDQRIADVSPLGTSLRDIDNGLYEPGDFAQVFEVPGLEGAFMRVQGAVYAVFDRSRYMEGRGGLQAIISANTVFYLGAPPEPFGTQDAAPAPPTSLVDERVDRIVPGQSLRVATRRSGRDDTDVDAHALPEGPAPQRQSIFGDAEYRAERLRALLRRATASRQAAAHAEAAPAEGR